MWADGKFREKENRKDVKRRFMPFLTDVQTGALIPYHRLQRKGRGKKCQKGV